MKRVWLGGALIVVLAATLAVFTPSTKAPMRHLYPPAQARRRKHARRLCYLARRRVFRAGFRFGLIPKWARSSSEVRPPSSSYRRVERSMISRNFGWLETARLSQSAPLGTTMTVAT